MSNTKSKKTNKQISKQEVLADYRLGWESRHASLMGRKEVFMGKAKFGIFGDGKELAQIAMAKSFREGDFRSGYYRDQTFMFAIGELTLQEYFAQLYAHTQVELEPASGGRSMNGHFGTRLLDDNGNWLPQTDRKNSSSDISPTAAQMPRLLGLAYASKLYRDNPDLHQFTDFSIKGNEVAFGTIGNASTSEGMFYEAMNAAGVLQVPMLMSIWDDAYGISVPAKYHTTKESISKILAGLQRNEEEAGFEIMTAKGWDYEELVESYKKAAATCRDEHVPVLLHITEMTQPQGHSTSGSHERYKSKERLDWESEYDCLLQFKKYILKSGIAESSELEDIESEAKQAAKEAREAAWKAFITEIKEERNQLKALLEDCVKEHSRGEKIKSLNKAMNQEMNPIRKDIISTARKALRYMLGESSDAKGKLIDWLSEQSKLNEDRYSSHLYSQSKDSPLNVSEIPPLYDEDSPMVDGREVLQKCFDQLLEKDPRVFAFGEDVGKIGDVNQAFAGLQDKFGELRVTDTGIRECTIIGQGIGTALRGLRPIAEIQYLDYLLYAIQILSDDLACLQYRTKGGQKAPLIVRTRGHRLEGIWHSGSPIGMILNSIRGMHVLVPRDMTRAAGFYNTLLQSDDPAIVIECLNGYRLKEKVPMNLADFTVPLGVPEVIREGQDITVVTYGSMCRIVQQAAQELEEFGISLEIIDIQSLLPFDVHHKIVESVEKTNRVIFADEDVPGGASAYMMQKVLEEQKAYFHLDAEPVTISAKAHRPAYSSDGDYFSKPSADDVFEKAYALMHEYNPEKYPRLN